MSDFARLNKGFVNWQGQRVFVPWFGALRIVIAADEIPIRRNGERQHYVWALAFFPSVIAAFWIGDPDPMRGLVVGIALSLAFSWLRDYRHVRHWPKLAGRVGYWQFRLAYPANATDRCAALVGGLELGGCPGVGISVLAVTSLASAGSGSHVAGGQTGIGAGWAGRSGVLLPAGCAYRRCVAATWTTSIIH